MTNLATRALIALCAGAMVLVLGLGVMRPGERRGPPAASIAVADALRGAAEGYARASEPRLFAFPDDHGPHPDYRTEWWYYTGNLATAEGRRFGFQLTFFRIAQAPAAAPRPSKWAATQVFMAHLAVTDVAGGRFHPATRVVRDALDLAGATARPFRVWTEDWSVEGEGEDALPMRLRAGEGPVAIDLVLEEGKPLVLHGERGLSRKGPGEGNASYYYSFTRMPARGTVRIGAERFAVTGSAWMDREWSTSALGADQIGWDWFALQLLDGRDLMVYRLRRRDGAIDPFSAGTIVGADGLARQLYAAEVIIEPLAWWTSPRGGTRYPARWRLTVPREALTLEIAPVVADQEFAEPVRYWEGAVRVEGRAGGRPVGGLGYVELVGYADAAGSGGADAPARRSRSASSAAAATAMRTGPSTIPSSPKAPRPPTTLMSTRSPFSSTRPLMRIGRRMLSTVPTTKMPANARMPAFVYSPLNRK
jgi:predicted secreted hydrolase